MELSVMRTFLAVVRCGSFTAAAQTLGLSQPTVTAHVGAMEAELGQQLFERGPRGVAATSVAEELAREMAEHVDALAAISRRGREPLATPVHLAGPAELTSLRVVPALAGLCGRGLKLRVSFGLADDLLAGLAAGRFDLVVSTVRPRLRGVTATPPADEEFVLVGAPSWAEGLDLSVDPVAALAGVPLVAYAEELPIIRRYWRSVLGVPPPGRAAAVVPDLRGVLAATAAGIGITVLPRYLCARALAEGELVALLEPEVPPINTIFLAARTGTTGLPHLAAVRSVLLAAARTW
ncbi:LysR family transcriptional regulator [Amycolatopsis cynarae]|uniref:LysR family transcriptional regulator n=1 Tax=Amycolatopsis cynarae TaxID=2995223 RepID=A0ABY7B6Z6_9PSEU|nr:LysR family transcriptional regulator [Amycolatopsis sp. HUAS 11-8]WAL66958.1 LysR family transcriptional regulator [Amycolatopsis sp. HUAS 11-8]